MLATFFCLWLRLQHYELLLIKMIIYCFAKSHDKKLIAFSSGKIYSSLASSTAKSFVF